MGVAESEGEVGLQGMHAGLGMARGLSVLGQRIEGLEVSCRLGLYVDVC